MRRASCTSRTGGPDRRLIAVVALERDALVVACAISAGIHAALTPSHSAESTGAGLGFATAAVLLAGLVVALTVHPYGALAVVGAAAVLAGLVASYARLPLFHPEPEQVDGLALGTKGIEAVGLLAAAHLLRPDRAAFALTAMQSRGRTT